MKLSIDEILKKIEEEMEDWKICNFIASLDLTPEQMEFLADYENKNVRYGLAQHPKLPKDLIYKLSEDEDVGVRWEISGRTNLSEDSIIRLGCDVYVHTKDKALQRLNRLDTLKLEDLESAYDLINNSKYIRKQWFQDLFDYIINKFPELKKLAKMFKRIILKGKKDLK